MNMKDRFHVTAKHPSFTLLALALLLAGCASTRTAYQTPDATMPAAWEQQQAATAATAQIPEQWWRQFGGGRDVPMSVSEALDRADDLTRPAAILIRTNGRLSESVSYRFADGRTFVDTRRLDGAGA